MAIGLKKRRRMQMIAAGAVLLAAATGVIGYAMRDGIEYFRTPAQLAAEPPRPGQRFRLGGLVEAGSVVHDGGTVRFAVTDGTASVPVAFTGLLPDLFREGQGVIAAGTLDGGTFAATEVLARHDENYMPKEVAEALKEQGLFHADGEGAAKPGS